jgi:cyclopropane-fatty-acyl-phospholipid synthase
VRVLPSDYCDRRGRYDKLVSIEMIEAVGWQYFDTFFRRRGELLSPGGLMLLQAIVIDHGAYHVERSSRSFVRELIFPSGCLPSLELISDCVVRAAFLDAAGRADQLGYDRRLRRLWELYFSYCEGGFRERRIQTVQTSLARPGIRGPAPRRRAAALLAGS